MDIQIIGDDTLRIKSKKTTLAIDPKKGVTKFDADAVLAMGKVYDASRINESRITINAVGEYEVSGLKISSIKSGDDIMYELISENSSAIIAKSSSLEKVSADKMGDYQIAIINVDSDLNQSIVTAMEPRVVVLYGEKSKEGAKALGKETISSTSKISVSEDKFPEELEITLLK